MRREVYGGQVSVPVLLVVMGVSGAGKSTLGEALAVALGGVFQDGDDLHPPANRAKIASGRPLDDLDRAPWLAAVGAWLDARAALGQPAVVACSALKRRYRDMLASGRPGVRFVWLAVAPQDAEQRLAARQGHFMPPSLLASQFAALEPPAPDERHLRLDAAMPTARQVRVVEAWLADGG